MNARTRHREGGQVIVLFTLALVLVIIPVVALVIDVGNAYANLRANQNSADASAETGATVLSQRLLGLTRTDAQVLSAMNLTRDPRTKPFGPDDAGHSVAYYTDVAGNLLTSAGVVTTDTAQAARVGGNTIPTCTGTTCASGQATGVQAIMRRDVGTLIAGAIGVASFPATSAATAVSGYSSGVCDTDEGCALLPVTFATSAAVCAGNGDSTYPGPPWTVPTPGDYTPATEIILSLCKNGPGAVGWLDLGGGNIADQISDPDHDPIPIPTWLQTQPGNPNNVEDELSAYFGNTPGVYEKGEDQMVLIPLFDGTCRTDKPDSHTVDFSGGYPGVCQGGQAGDGNNTYYHIPYFIGFILDRAYVQGNNFPECNQAPGSPFSEGNGSNGCFKGWFAKIVGAPGPVSANPGPGGPNTPLYVQLVK